VATGFLYHSCVPDLAERLLRSIRKQELIKPGDRVAAAVSAGADSVALLLLLVDLRKELGIVLSVAHVNHKLRCEESDADELFVAELAQRHHLEFHSAAAPILSRDGGIEAAARELRYDFFRRLARENRVSKVATAHTLDDQAETVLLRILRGTGIRGLSGIHPRLPLLEPEGGESSQDAAEVIRPLLAVRRDELRGFLHQQNQAWREDSSNRDPGFLRNRVRHEVLPLLNEAFSPRVEENLADLAEIARVEDEHWATAHPEVCLPDDSLEIAWLSSLPLVGQRRLILNWLETRARAAGISFRLIEEILELAHNPAGKRLELAGGQFVVKTQRSLCLEPAGDPCATEYEYPLSVPGQIQIPELGVRIEAVLADPKSVPEEERDRLLDPARLPTTMVIRNWRPGDRFWPAHTKAAKKVKDLLSDRHIAGVQKTLWPVAVAENLGLVWMRGFAVPAILQPAPGASRVVWIRETKAK